MGVMENNPEIRTPGDYLRTELKKRGWTQTDLAKILDRPLPTVNRILQGKHGITPDMAVTLGAALGDPPELWMQREMVYRLSLAKTADETVKERSRLYKMAPVKEMMKRGWIETTADPAVLSAELCRFFGTDNLATVPSLCAHTKKTGRTSPMTNEQQAWCFRARHMALSLEAERFTDTRFNKGIAELRKIAAWPEEVRRVPRILASMGVRFVIVEPLLRTKIDGASFWLNRDSPVVALSARYDRIDSFWHSLGHELSHIKNRDGLSVDAGIVGEDRISPVELDATERRADEEAAFFVIDQVELQDFIARVGPMYSRDRINQFANRLCVHPGIIVGQLQYRAEIGYSAFRNMLVKVREFVTSKTLTDGWGHTFNQ